MTSQIYSRGVTTENGYTLFYPCVTEGEDLLQSYPPNPYAQSLGANFPLGTVLVRGKREWVYCKNGGVALTIAQPIQSSAVTHADSDNDLVVGVDAAIGDLVVSVASTANIDEAPFSTVDGLKGGYLIVNDATGEGQMYEIKGNTAFATTGQALITLYDPLTIALVASTSECGIIPSPYTLVVATAAPLSGMFVGVAMIPVTINYYFWAGCGGPHPVITQAAITKGSPVVVGKTAAKANVMTTAGTTEVIIGEAMTTGEADAQYITVNLWKR